MSQLLRFLGLGSHVSPSADAGETESVRKIVARLEGLEPEKARSLAAFAYVLARVANADLEIDAEEIRQMEQIVREVASLSEHDASIAVEIARTQAKRLGGTENYLVTRELRNLSTREERFRVLRCLYAVAGADGRVSSFETTEIAAIANELGIRPSEAAAARKQWGAKQGDAGDDALEERSSR